MVVAFVQSLKPAQYFWSLFVIGHEYSQEEVKIRLECTEKEVVEIFFV